MRVGRRHFQLPDSTLQDIAMHERVCLLPGMGPAAIYVLRRKQEDTRAAQFSWTTGKPCWTSCQDQRELSDSRCG